MQRDEIKTFLPHREPMLLVDDVVKEGEYAIGHYHVNGDEFFLQGHFPGYPVVPGVILCEIMAQSCCILIREELEKGCTPFYSGIDKVKTLLSAIPAVEKLSKSDKSKVEAAKKAYDVLSDEQKKYIDDVFTHHPQSEDVTVVTIKI